MTTTDDARLFPVARRHVRQGVDDAGKADTAPVVVKEPKLGTKYRIGYVEIPYRRIRQCKVCEPPPVGIGWQWRLQVETGYVHGETFKGMWSDLPDELQDHLSWETIRRHCRKHLPNQLVAERASLDARIEAAVQQANDEVAINIFDLAEVVITRTYADVRAGRKQATVTDAIALGKMQIALGFGAATSEDRSMFRLVVAELMRLAMDFVPLDRQDAFVDALNADQALRHLVLDRQVLAEPGATEETNLLDDESDLAAFTKQP